MAAAITATISLDCYCNRTRVAAERPMMMELPQQLLWLLPVGLHWPQLLRKQG